MGLYNQAKSGTITIPSTENSYILEFDKNMYNLEIDFEGSSVAVDHEMFKYKINDGDSIKIYDTLYPVNFEKFEVYKIEFIKQRIVNGDIEVYYQGFIKG